MLQGFLTPLSSLRVLAARQPSRLGFRHCRSTCHTTFIPKPVSTSLFNKRCFSSPFEMSMDKVANPTIADADRLLASRFGHPKFREGQREVIDLLLANETTNPDIPNEMSGRALAIFPTGSGKSLCYQLPSLLYSDGLTLVVSPLMALMKDQVDSLVRKDVKAACLDSSLSGYETRELYERIQSNDVCILFVSPERFNNSRFTNMIRSIQIALFAVDEAHCISEWGHSFRPDYLRLSRWCNRLNIKRRLALTATATPQVAEDICQSLSIPFPYGQVRLPNVRPNLTTRVTVFPSATGIVSKSSSNSKENTKFGNSIGNVSSDGNMLSLEDTLRSRVDALASRLKERPPGPTIVYVTLQATARIVAEMLRKRSLVQAQPYHAGMNQDDRKRVQDTFMDNKKDSIVVATIAFGMGMDHDSIRYVYHLNIPKSLEGYIQEIGRAGRDGLPSICESLVSIDDIPTLEGFVYGEMPSKKTVYNVIQELFSDIKHYDDTSFKADRLIEYSTYDLCFKHDIRDSCLGQLIAQLDLTEGLIEETTPFYSIIECGIPVKADRRFPPETTPEGKMIAASVAKSKLLHVDVRKVSEETGYEYGKIARMCDDLLAQGVFSKVNVRKLVHRAKVKEMPSNIEQISYRLFKLLMISRDRQIHRLQQVVDFYSSQTCQTKFLANHLGDEITTNGGNCGHCQVCLDTSNSAQDELDDYHPFNFKSIVQHRVARTLDERRWALIQLAAIPKDDPYLVARFATGISSPIISRKFKRLPTFGSMSDHDFNVVLKAAAKFCNVELKDEDI